MAEEPSALETLDGYFDLLAKSLEVSEPTVLWRAHLWQAEMRHRHERESDGEIRGPTFDNEDADLAFSFALGLGPMLDAAKAGTPLAPEVISAMCDAAYFIGRKMALAELAGGPDTALELLTAGRKMKERTRAAGLATGKIQRERADAKWRTNAKATAIAVTKTNPGLSRERVAMVILWGSEAVSKDWAVTGNFKPVENAPQVSSIMEWLRILEGNGTLPSREKSKG